MRRKSARPQQTDEYLSSNRREARAHRSSDVGSLKDAFGNLTARAIMHPCSRKPSPRRGGASTSTGSVNEWGVRHGPIHLKRRLKSPRPGSYVIVATSPELSM